MRKLVGAAAIGAVIGFVGIIGWQASAAVPALHVPQAGPYTPIHPAACNGADEHCPSGSHWVCGPYGQRCWCTLC